MFVFQSLVYKALKSTNKSRYFACKNNKHDLLWWTSAAWSDKHRIDIILLSGELPPVDHDQDLPSFLSCPHVFVLVTMWVLHLRQIVDQLKPLCIAIVKIKTKSFCNTIGLEMNKQLGKPAWILPSWRWSCTECTSSYKLIRWCFIGVYI